MADFDYCFEKTLEIEGGYDLSVIPNDRGGWTYAGISRRFHPDWIGWEMVDIGNQPAPETVMDFYWAEFWKPLRCDEIVINGIAWPIYDFAVTSGKKTAVRAAQKILGVVNDGIIGPKTISELNSVECHHFKVEYFISRVRFYLDLARRDRTQRGFLLSWIGRAIAGV